MEINFVNVGAVSIVVLDQPLASDIPDLDRFVLTSARNTCAIRMELNRVNTGTVVLERVNLLTRVEVPELNSTVIGTRCNKASVRRELARFNPVLMGLRNRE